MDEQNNAQVTETVVEVTEAEVETGGEGNGKREMFKGGFGMLMAMIGAAVGLGNLWRFPYMTGMMGGGAFVLLYLVIIFLVGYPTMMAEWAFGRHYRKGPVGAFKASGIKGGKFYGWLNFANIFVATSYYSLIIGWALYYLVNSLTGGYASFAEGTGGFYDALLGSFSTQFIYTVIVVVLVVACLAFGVKRGIERVAKICMPVLFVMMLILVVRSLTLPNAMEGLAFYLKPDFSKFNMGVLLGAMGQAFFSLCLGGTFMVIMGSYMPDNQSIRKTAVQAIVGDTAAGLMAGFIILPAAFSFGLEVSSGPPLTFITVPEIFKSMGGTGGAIFGAMFFLLLFLAAYLSDIAAYEVIVATFMEEFNMTRKKALILTAVGQIIAVIPSALSLNFLLKVDILAGTTLQPVGSLLAVVAFIWMLPKLKAMEELQKSDKKPFPNWMYVWMRYVVPILIGVVVIMGARDLFIDYFMS